MSDEMERRVEVHRMALAEAGYPEAEVWADDQVIWTSGPVPDEVVWRAGELSSAAIGRPPKCRACNAHGYERWRDTGALPAMRDLCLSAPVLFVADCGLSRGGGQ